MRPQTPRSYHNILNFSGALPRVGTKPLTEREGDE
jgi:hypothetical protein